MASDAETISLLDSAIIARARRDAFVKLNPAGLIRNLVIFAVEIAAMLVTVLGVHRLIIGESWGIAIAIAASLWLTVLFATFAPAADGRTRTTARPNGGTAKGERRINGRPI